MLHRKWTRDALPVRSSDSVKKGLKFARPFRRPTLHHNLGLREKFHRVAALSVKIAEKAVLPAAEGEECHRRGDADVAPDISGFDAAAESAG